MTDLRDAALQSTCPCVAVPRYGELPQAGLGQRVLVASNGVFLEVRRSWLDCIVRIGELPRTPALPYGVLTERISFTFGVIPLALLEELIATGREGLPNEVAGALIYDRAANTLRLAVHDAVVAGPAEVRYRMPVFAPCEELAVDLHTHGWPLTCMASRGGGHKTATLLHLQKNCTSRLGLETIKTS